MPLHKAAPKPECSQQGRRVVEDGARRRTIKARLAERAQMVLGSQEGNPVCTMHESLTARPATAIDWRRRFEVRGDAGLEVRQRSGKPPQDGEQFPQADAGDAGRDTPERQPVWEGPDLSRHLKASVHSIRCVLPKEGISPGQGSAVGAAARIRRFEPRRLTSCGST